jgi:hypothetical protein
VADARTPMTLTECRGINHALSAFSHFDAIDYPQQVWILYHPQEKHRAQCMTYKGK